MRGKTPLYMYKDRGKTIIDWEDVDAKPSAKQAVEDVVDQFVDERMASKKGVSFGYIRLTNNGYLKGVHVNRGYRRGR